MSAHSAESVACCSHCQDTPGGCEMCRHLFSDKVMMLDWLQAPEDEDCRRYGCTAAHIDGAVSR